MAFMFLLGSTLLISSMMINDQLAGKTCGANARKYNSGVIILGTALVVLSTSTFICESKCEKFDNAGEQTEYLEAYIAVVTAIALVVFILSLMSIIDLKDSDCAKPKKIAEIQVIISSAILAVIIGMGSIKFYEYQKTGENPLSYTDPNPTDGGGPVEYL
jgi:hypothetical protein